MKKKSQDKRTQKTDQLLRDTLIKLMLDRPLKDISVTEISRLCDINRSTFYQYYYSVYDLHQAIENELLELFMQKIERSFDKEASIFTVAKDAKGTERLPVLAELFKIIQENSDITQVLLRNPDSQFLNKLYKTGRTSFLRKVRESLAPELYQEADYYFNFVMNGCTGMVIYWIRGGMKISAEECALLAEKFVLHMNRYFIRKP